MGLRLKILLPLVSLGSILLVYLYGYWMPRSLANMEAGSLRSIESHLDSVAEGLVPLLLGHQLDTIYENLDSLMKKNRDWVSIRLVAADGRPLYPLVTSPPAAADSRRGKDIHIVERRINYAETKLGSLILTVDFAPRLSDIRKRHWELMSVMLVTIIIFTAMAGFVVDRLVRRPVNLLARASQRLAAGDFDVPLVKAGDDEIGILVDSFEEMRKAIREYRSTRKQAEEEITWNLAINQALSSLYILLVTAGANIEQIADTILEKSKQLTSSAHGFVAEIDPTTGDQIAHTLSRMMPECKVVEEELRIIRFPRGADGLYNGLWGYALNTGAPFYTNVPVKHHASVGIPEGHFVIERFLAVPVLLSGELVGQIALSNSARDYTDRDLKALDRIAEFYALAIQRKRAEGALSERVMLAELSADIGYSLTMQGDLQSILNKCAEALVQRLDVAFARVWTFNAAENVLELQASAGMYTAIDGSHSRVRLGELKVGLIAQERKPHVTNSVIGDPLVHDQEWAKREGMVAFAGHPLTVEERLVGVMAMFSRNPLTDVTIKALASVSNEIAIGIERKQAEEALRRLTEELEERVKERTAELETKNEELARLNKLFIGRELKMAELKVRIRALEKDGRPDGES